MGAIGNQYLIDVQLKNLQNLRALGDEIARIQTLSKTGAAFSVGIDAKSLTGLERRLQETVNSALGGSGVGGGARSSGGGTATDAAMLRDLNGHVSQMKEHVKALTTAVNKTIKTPSVGGARVVDGGIAHIEEQFEQLAMRITKKLRKNFQQLTSSLDFDKVLEQSDRWREAKAAGLRRPFGNNEAGLREALGIYRNRTPAGNPVADPAQFKLARDRVWQEYQNYTKALASDRRAIAKHSERRQKAENYLMTLTMQEGSQQRSLMQTGEVGIKGVGAVSARGARSAKGQIKEFKAFLKDRRESGEKDTAWMRQFTSVTPYVEPTKSKDETLSQWNSKVAQAKAKFQMESDRAKIMQYVAGGVNPTIGGERAFNQRMGRADEMAKELQLKNSLFKALRPERPGNAPNRSPLDILASTDPVAHGKMLRKMKKGWEFREYGQAENDTLLAALGHLDAMGRETTSPDAATRVGNRMQRLASIHQMGGEWQYVGRDRNLPFRGFTRLQKGVGNLNMDPKELTPEGLAHFESFMSRAGVRWSVPNQFGEHTGRVIGGSLAGGGGGAAPTNFEHMAASFEHLAKVDMSGVASNIEKVVTMFVAANKAMGAIDPRKMSAIMNERKEEFKVAAYGRNEEAKESKRDIESTLLRQKARQTAQATTQRTEAQLRVQEVRKANQRELILERERVKKEAALLRQLGGSGQSEALDAALAQQGFGGRMSLTGGGAVKALRRNLRGIAREQERNEKLRVEFQQRQVLGLGTSGTANALVNSNLNIDKNTFGYMQALGPAGRMLPAQFGGMANDAQTLESMIRNRNNVQQQWFRRAQQMKKMEKQMDSPGTSGEQVGRIWQEYQGVSVGLNPQGFKSHEDYTKWVHEARAGEDAFRNSLLKRGESMLATIKPLKEQTNYVEYLGGKLKSIATYTGLGLVMYGIGGAISAVTRDVITLDEKLASLRVVLPNASLSDMLEIRQGVIAGAREFGQNMGAAVDAARVFAQMGMSPGDIVSSTRSVMAAMVGLGMSSESATNLAVSTSEMTGGRLKGSDMFDRIAKIRSSGHPVDAEGIAQVVGRAGALGIAMQPQSMGVDALGVLLGSQTVIQERNRSAGGSQVAATVGYMLSKMMAPGTQKAMQQQFGIRMGTGRGDELRPFTDVMTDIAAMYKASKGTAKGDSLIASLAGPRQGRQLITLFEHWDEVMKIALESSNSLGEAEKAAAVGMGALTFRMGQFGGAMRTYMDKLLRSVGILGGAGTSRAIGLAGSAVTGASKYPVAAAITGMGTTAGLTYLGSKGFGWVAKKLAAKAAVTSSSALAGEGLAVAGGEAAGGLGVGAAAGTLGTGLAAALPYILIIAAIVTAVMGVLKLGNLLAGSDTTTGDDAKLAAIQQHHDELVKASGLPASRYDPASAASLNLALGHTEAKFPGFLSGKTNPKAYESYILEASKQLRSQGFNVPTDIAGASQMIGSITSQKIAELANKTPQYKMVEQTYQEVVGKGKPVTRTRMVPGTELTDESRADAALLSRLTSGTVAQTLPGNRPKGFLPEGLTGNVPFRDRLLEALVTYGVSQAESGGMKKYADQGVLGFDYASAQRQNARSLVEGTNKAFVETKADVIRAREAVMFRQAREGVSDSETNVLADGSFATSADVKAEQAVGKAKADLNLRDRLIQAQNSAQTLSANKTLVSQLPQRYLADLADLVKGDTTKMTPKEGLAFAQKYLDTVTAIEDMNKKALTDADVLYFAQQRSLKAVELQAEFQSQMLDIAQQRARVTREAATSLISSTGMPGEDLSSMLSNILASGQDEAAKARQAGAGERAVTASKLGAGLIGTNEANFLNEQTKINEDRKVVVAEDTANTNALQRVLERRIELIKAESSSSDAMLKTMGSGLNDALSKPFKEGFAGRPGEMIGRIVEPGFGAMRKRMADNFTDVFTGPNGIFGDQFGKVFQSGAVLEYDLILKAHNEGAVAVSDAITGALNGTPVVGVTAAGGIGGLTGATTVAVTGAVAGAIKQTHGFVTDDGSVDGGSPTAINFGGGASLPASSTKGMTKKQAAALYAAQTVGTSLISALSSPHGIGGKGGARIGASGGYNYADEGGTVGGFIGGAAFGAPGAAVGSLLGGLLGGLIGKRHAVTPEFQALDAISRNTKESVTAIENQTKMLTLGDRLMNVPSNFTIPSYSIAGGNGFQVGGGVPSMSATPGPITIQVNGANDPQATARAVAAELRSQLLGQGSFNSTRIR